ncbi:MAG: DUF3604 domain-containing protein [Acidobacteria bacterium]|nr:DUF3604 domain-containing protein [Acidobacteriota bacterium]
MNSYFIRSSAALTCTATLAAVALWSSHSYTAQEGLPILISRLGESGPPNNNGYPAIARTPDGALWVAWAGTRTADSKRRGRAVDLEKADYLVVKRRGTAGWSNEVRVNSEGLGNPEIAIVASGMGILAVWSARKDGDFELFAMPVNADMTLGEMTRLTSSAGSDAAPVAVASPDGTVWVAWEACRNGLTQVEIVSWRGGVWGAPIIASRTGEDAFRPSLALGSDGTLSLAWDGGGAERYRVYLRQNRGGVWEAIREAPAPESADVYAPRIAVDPRGRVWMVYAQNPSATPEWGLRGFRGGRGPRPLVRSAVFDGSSWLHSKDGGLITANGDMPLLAITSSGAVHVFFIRFKSHLNIRLWSSRFVGGAWTEPAPMDRPDEEEYGLLHVPNAPKARSDQRPAVIADGERITVAYESGGGWGYDRQIAVRELGSGPESSGGLTQVLAHESSLRPAISSLAEKLTGNDNRRFSIFFGDLHGHLLMDDGWTGTADQYYRFARDRRLLDFAAYTPHAESNKLLGSEIGIVQRNATAFKQSGRFIGISGWEWTQGDFRFPREGHKHVIYETDDQPFYSSLEAGADSIAELNERIRKTSGIMFAHHIARGWTGGTNFDATDTTIEPDVEIASHWGRFEYYKNPGHTKDEVSGSSVQDAWAKPLEIGVVGGSDNHDLYSERATALTAVLAERLDRHSIFEALRSRRCYATTGEKIIIDFRVNESWMGSKIRSKKSVVIRARVKGTDLLEKLEVVKFWKGAPQPYPVVHQLSPGEREAAFEWRDPQFTGDCAYYLRVTQRADPRIVNKTEFGNASSFPNEMAWSSPVWVQKE